MSTQASLWGDPPEWDDCASHTFPAFQDKLIDFCIRNDSAWVLFETETGSTAPTEATHADFARLNKSVQMKVFTVLKSAAGLYWPQFQVFTTTGGGESLKTTTIISRDATTTYEKFKTHAQETTVDSAGSVLMSDFHNWTWATTGSTHRAQILASIDSATQLRSRSIAFNSADYALSGGMLVSKIITQIPKAFRDVGAARYRSIVTFSALQAELIADSALVEPLRSSKVLFTPKPSGQGAGWVPKSRIMDKDAGPWHPVKGAIWCSTHGWSKHDDTTCNAQGQGGARKPSSAKSTDKCFVCGTPGHYGRDCPGITNKPDAENLSKMALISKYSGNEVVQCKRNAAGELYVFFSLSTTLSTALSLLTQVPHARAIFIDSGGEISTENDRAFLTELTLYGDSARPQITGFDATTTTAVHGHGYRTTILRGGFPCRTLCQYVPDARFNIEATDALANAGVSTFVDHTTSNNQLSLWYKDGSTQLATAHGKLWCMPPSDNIPTPMLQFADSNSTTSTGQHSDDDSGSGDDMPGLVDDDDDDDETNDEDQPDTIPAALTNSTTTTTTEPRPDTILVQQPGTIPAELNNSTTTTTTEPRPDTIPAPLLQLTDSTATTTADTKPTAPPPPLPPSPTPAKLNESHIRASLMGCSVRQVGKLATSFGTTTCKPKDGNLDLVLREASQVATRVQRPNAASTNQPGTTFATDTIGNQQPGAKSGNIYFQCWLDPFERPLQPYVTCATNHTAAASVSALKDFIMRSEFPMTLAPGSATQFTCTTDGGSEYLGDYDDFLTTLGCRHTTATAYKHNTGQTAIVEGVNRILQTKCRNGIFLSTGNFTFLFGDSITGMMYVDYAYVHAGYVIRAHGQALALGEEYSTADKLAWLKQKVPAPWGSICTLKIQIGSSLGGDAIKQFKPRGITAIFIGVDQSRRYIVVTKTGKIHHSVDVSWNVKNCMQPLPLGAAGVVHHLWQSDGHIESGNTTAITNETFLEYYKDPTALMNEYDLLDWGMDTTTGTDATPGGTDTDQTATAPEPLSPAADIVNDATTPRSPPSDEDLSDVDSDDDGTPPPTPDDTSIDDTTPALPTANPDNTVHENDSELDTVPIRRAGRHRQPPALVLEDAQQRNGDAGTYTAPFAVNDRVKATYGKTVYDASVTAVDFDPSAPQDFDNVTVLYDIDGQDCVYERSDFGLLKTIGNGDTASATSTNNTVLAAWVQSTAHESIKQFMNPAGTNIRWELLTGVEQLPPPPPLPNYTRDKHPPEPNNIREALSSPDAIQWLYAYVSELGGQQQQPTYEYEKLSALKQAGKPNLTNQPQDGLHFQVRGIQAYTIQSTYGARSMGFDTRCRLQRVLHRHGTCIRFEGPRMHRRRAGVDHH